MTQSLSHNPKNKLKYVQCPDCGSKNWYRKVTDVFHCKKCSNEWVE